MDPEIKEIALRIAKSISRKIGGLKSQDINLGKNVGIGADGTPTKYIDKVAEDVAIRIIKKSKHHVNLLSEEAGFIDFGGDYTIILDPIDGTRNAARGIPFYATSVAVGKDSLSSIEYGVVINIPTSDTYIAEKGNGAYLNNHRISTPQHVSGKIFSSLVLGEGMNGEFREKKSVNKRAKKLPYEGNVRALGAASLEMSLVAHGAIDCFVCLPSHLRVTDIAASTLIVREANGIVCDRYGKELDMPYDLFERTSVIACINREILSQILSLANL